MRKNIVVVLGASLIFCLKMGAELMWPDISAWHWWSAAAVLFLTQMLVLYGPSLGAIRSRFRVIQRENSNPSQPKEKIYTARTVAELLSPLKEMSSL